jgi:hypothetical protein
MSVPRKRNARAQPGGFVEAVVQASEHRSAALTRTQAHPRESWCDYCGSPTPNGWRYCVTCHRWHDLAVSLEFVATLGIDEFLLHRSLNHIVPRPPPRRLATKASVRAAIKELLVRVEELERRA